MAGFLFCGGEDCDFQQSGSGLGVNTSTATFRSGFARCSIAANSSGFWRSGAAFTVASSVFWTTMRLQTSVPGFGSASPGTGPRWVDANNIVRLRIRNNGSPGANLQAGSNILVEKLNSVGAATQLGSNFQIPYNTSFPTGDLFKLDIFISYGTSGTINIYSSNSSGVSPVLIFSYSGDTTTDGNTTLAGIDLGMLVGGNTGATYSEVICHTASTLTMGLATQALTGNGNTDQWTGSYSNINGTTLSLSNPITSATPGQLEQFTVNAIPAGAFAVRAVVNSMIAQKGTTGPGDYQMNVRTGGSDYFGATDPLSALNVPLPYQYAFETNPATGLAWQTTDIGSAAGFNVGIRSEP